MGRAVFFLVLIALAATQVQEQNGVAYLEDGDDSRPITEGESVHHKLLHTRKALLSRLDRCTVWRDSLPEERKNALHNLLIKANFVKFKELAIHIAREVSPEDEDCLKSANHLIKKYNRIREKAKRLAHSEDGSHIEEFLSPRQIQELHAIYTQTKRKDEIIKALFRFFDGMSQEKKQKLVDEFFSYRSDLRRRPRHAKVEESIEENIEIEDPEELRPNWLDWMNPRQKNAIEKLKTGGSDKWEVMNAIADQYYHLRKDVRRKYDRHLQEYCNTNLKTVLGNTNFAALEVMFMDNDPVDQIETRFHEMIGDLKNERNRVLADKYGSFCRKVFRLVHFEPTDLTTWLNKEQRIELGDMISDPNIGDQQVYEKVYEFFEAVEGEQKEEATDTIDTGCRHFIAHMFGDDTAEELEDLKLQGNVSTQYLAARLAKHMKEISSEKERRRAEQSLPMCTRIYLNYNGSCDCNGHAEACDKTYHTCYNCTGYTFGVQCEQCIEGFTGDPTTGDCTPMEVEEVETETGEQLCECNMHASHCDETGRCIRCQHNTTGDNCELCAVGYYGDAIKGAVDDCSICPCPDGGACFINDDGLVQCATCPVGLKGVTCDKKDARSSESSEERG